MNSRVMGFLAAIRVNLAQSSIPPMFNILDFIGWDGDYDRVSRIEMRIANVENRFRLTYSQDDVAYYKGRRAGNFVIVGIGIYMGAKGIAGIANGTHSELRFTGAFKGGEALTAEVVEVIVVSGAGIAAIELIEGGRITLSAVRGIGSGGTTPEYKRLYKGESGKDFAKRLLD